VIARRVEDGHYPPAYGFDYVRACHQQRAMDPLRRQQGGDGRNAARTRCELRLAPGHEALAYVENALKAPVIRELQLVCSRHVLLLLPPQKGRKLSVSPSRRGAAKPPRSWMLSPF